MFVTRALARALPPLGGALDMRDSHPADIGVDRPRVSEVTTPHRRDRPTGDRNSIAGIKALPGLESVVWDIAETTLNRKCISLDSWR